MNINKYFDKLQNDTSKIDLSYKYIKVLPPLFTRFHRLIILDCTNNLLSRLPFLPPTLQDLYCPNNILTELPCLPITLKTIWCSKNKLTKLPSLPYRLENLDCSNNQLKELPQLPLTLKYLVSDNNQLTKLPILPGALTWIKCNINLLTKLPILPPLLINLGCAQNKLTNLPLLPSTLIYLDCRKNQIEILPLLPEVLNKLWCSHNQINILPYIFNRSIALEYIDNPLDELIDTYDVDIINKSCKIIRNLKFIYYSCKYKKRFIDFYYMRIVEPKVRFRANPEYLIQIINNDTNVELEKLIEQFENYIDT